jgi:hypothetical protein
MDLEYRHRIVRCGSDSNGALVFFTGPKWIFRYGLALLSVASAFCPVAAGLELRIAAIGPALYLHTAVFPAGFNATGNMAHA